MQYICDEQMNDNDHIISQVTVSVWHIKNHFMILVMTDGAADDDIFDLCVIICGASDDTDAWDWLKWSHMNEQEEEVMKDTAVNIND